MFQNLVANLLLVSITGISGYQVSRIDKIEDQVAQIRVDVAVLKAREPAIASLTSPLR